MTKTEIVVLLLIGLLSCVAYAEPLRLSRTGCGFYAQDAGQIASARDAGVLEEATQSHYASMPYHPEVKPHLIELIHFVYSSSLTPEEAERALFLECVNNEGWIGKAM